MNDNISASINEVLIMLNCAKMNMQAKGNLLQEEDLYYPFTEGVTTREEADALVKELAELIEAAWKTGRNY